MITQNYKCVGMFHKDTLIGICGLWFMTRHYVGKVVEADHVIISAKYRGRNLGKKCSDGSTTSPLRKVMKQPN